MRRRAAAIEQSDTAAQDRWLRAGFDVLQSVEQGPYAVLPTKDRRRRNGVTPWAWVDEYPLDVTAREHAETALAYTELWRSLAADDFVQPAELVTVLTRLEMFALYAAVSRQVDHERGPAIAWLAIPKLA